MAADWERDRYRSWRDEPVTDKQKNAIRNMADALGMTTYEMPQTKGEASDMIDEMRAEFNIFDEWHEDQILDLDYRI